MEIVFIQRKVEVLIYRIKVLGCSNIVNKCYGFLTA